MSSKAALLVEGNVAGNTADRYVFSLTMLNYIYDFLLSSIYPPNTHPEDLDDIPEHLAAEDSIPQEEVSNSILHEIMRSSAESDNYDIREPKDLTLSHLKSLYEKNLHSHVIQIMRKYRARVKLTGEDMYSHQDPNVAWKAGSAHKLDYICALGNTLGIHAALTNTRVNDEYEFILHPKPAKQFSGKYAQLGFDQAASLLYIGSRPGEEVYLCMVPTDTLLPSFDTPPPVGLCTGSTTLSPDHARILTIFICYCLSLMADATGVCCIEPYI